MVRSSEQFRAAQRTVRGGSAKVLDYQVRQVFWHGERGGAKVSAQVFGLKLLPCLRRKQVARDLMVASTSTSPRRGAGVRPQKRELMATGCARCMRRSLAGKVLHVWAAERGPGGWCICHSIGAGACEANRNLLAVANRERLAPMRVRNRVPSGRGRRWPGSATARRTPRSCGSPRWPPGAGSRCRRRPVGVSRGNSHSSARTVVRLALTTIQSLAIKGGG